MMNSTKLYYVSDILGFIILSSIIHKGFPPLKAYMEFFRSTETTVETVED